MRTPHKVSGMRRHSLAAALEEAVGLVVVVMSEVVGLEEDRVEVQKGSSKELEGEVGAMVEVGIDGNDDCFFCQNSKKSPFLRVRRKFSEEEREKRKIRKDFVE